tara:strand:- start:6786 stop:7391 length:606 start_codon:yes stop_codon:yes gene_type:complete
MYQTKKLKKFDDIEDKIFTLKTINFYKNNKVVKTKIYNKVYNKLTQLEFNLLSYDYLIMEYLINNKLYKYISKSSNVIFPLYNKHRLKNFIYINQIKNAILIIPDELNNKKKINITNDLLKFIGPNYNFYKDLGEKIERNLILDHILTSNDECNNLLNNLINNLPTNLQYYLYEYELKLYDNFNKEYNIDKYIDWNPNLQM